MRSEREFFVPFTESESEAESAYSTLAHSCHAALPPLNNRVYSITFKHNGETWVATVGERLAGSKLHVSKSKDVQKQHQVPLSDPAVVVAIFAGNPYFVVTATEPGIGRSAWENPFMAGSPSAVVHFRVKE